MMRRIVLAAAVVTVLVSSASGYDNKFTHPKINEMAFQKFMVGAGKQAPFARYEFSGSAPWSGVEWERVMNDIEAGNWIPPVQQSFVGALQYGGYTADLPVKPQSLRHFYDPTSKSTPWLTDLVDATTLDVVTSRPFMGKNPHTSAKGWALGLPNEEQSPYSITAGVAFYNQYCATRMPLGALKAWLSIGQTMHLLGDMGLPAHVRNDGHPGIAKDLFEKWKSDPYENWVDANMVAEYWDKSVDPKVARDIAAAKDPGQLFDVVAKYANENFPSQDTLAGTAEDGTHFTSANELPEYPTPQLTKFDGEYFYVDDYAGKCLMARRCWTSIASGAGGVVPETVTADGFVEPAHPEQKYIKVPRYFITLECVQSQARRLVPMVVTANARLLEMIMPRFQVQMTGLDAATRRASGRITSTGGYGAPRQVQVCFFSGGKPGPKVDAVAVDSDGSFSVAVPDSLLSPAPETSSGPGGSSGGPAVPVASKPAAPKTAGSWGAADYLANLPDDLEKDKSHRWYMASPPPSDASKAQDYNGTVRNEGGKLVQSFVISNDPDFARRWHDSSVQPKLSVAAVSVRIEVKECANRAAAEAYVNTMGLRVPVSNTQSLQGIEALDRIIYKGSNGGYTFTYIDDRFVVHFITDKALSAPQNIQPWFIDPFKKRFATGSAGGGSSTAAKSSGGSSSTAKPPADTASRKVRLGVGIDMGGFLLKSDEKDFQF
jgi:hypothetical protein